MDLDKLHSEEVRGLFVLGVIAVLIIVNTKDLSPVARVLIDTLLGGCAPPYPHTLSDERPPIKFLNKY